MGVFSQPLMKRRTAVGSSIRPATPQLFQKGECFVGREDVVVPLAPMNNAESSFSLETTTTRYRIPFRFWNIRQTPKPSSAVKTTMSSRTNSQMVSELDMNRLLSLVEEEWNNENYNDDVNLLLPSKNTSRIDSIMKPHLRDGNSAFDMTSTLSSSSSSSLSSLPYPQLRGRQRHLTTPMTTSRFASPSQTSLWKRVSLLSKKNAGTNHTGHSKKWSDTFHNHKPKKSKREIEIQFESFVEDDDDDDDDDFHVNDDEFLFSLSVPPTNHQTTLTTPPPSDVRRRWGTVPSWLSNTVGVAQRKCTTTRPKITGRDGKDRASIQPQRTNSSEEPTTDDDDNEEFDEEEEGDEMNRERQITSNKVNVRQSSSSSISSIRNHLLVPFHNLHTQDDDDDVTMTNVRHCWDMPSSPVQFVIPSNTTTSNDSDDSDIFEPSSMPSSWEYAPLYGTNSNQYNCIAAAVATEQSAPSKSSSSSSMMMMMMLAPIV